MNTSPRILLTHNVHVKVQHSGTTQLLPHRFPKGTDLSRWSAEDFEAVAIAINNRPRKILAWRNLAESFEEQLSSLQQPGVASTD